MPGGKDLEDLVVFPVLGHEMLQTTGLEPVPSFSGFSPSDFIISLEQLPHDLQTVPDVESLVDLLGNASWREAGVFFSRTLGFPTEPAQGGFEEAAGFDKVATEGVVRQVLLGSGLSGNASEEDRRVSLGVAE